MQDALYDSVAVQRFNGADGAGAAAGCRRTPRERHHLGEGLLAEDHPAAGRTGGPRLRLGTIVDRGHPRRAGVDVRIAQARDPCIRSRRGTSGTSGSPVDAARGWYSSSRRRQANVADITQWRRDAGVGRRRLNAAWPGARSTGARPTARRTGRSIERGLSGAVAWPRTGPGKSSGTRLPAAGRRPQPQNTPFPATLHSFPKSPVPDLRLGHVRWRCWLIPGRRENRCSREGESGRW